MISLVKLERGAKAGDDQTFLSVGSTDCDLALSLSRARSGSKERKKRKKLFPSPTHLEVSRRARQRLHVDAPLLRVEAEGRQRTVLAEGLGLVDELVAAVVAGA